MVENVQIDIINNINFIDKIKHNKYIGVIYNFNDYNVNLNNIKNAYLVIDLKYILENQLLRKYVKYIIKLKKKLNRKKIQLGIEYENKKIVASIINAKDISKKIYDELSACIIAITYDNLKQKYEYIYDTVCEYLDNSSTENNYCDFKNDVCIAKRNSKKDNMITMGCCHRFNHSNICGKMKLCEYLKNKKCSIQCITCKLFMCDYLKVKYKFKDILLLYCFFNIIQKIILKTSFFTPKEVILKRLLFFKLRS